MPSWCSARHWTQSLLQARQLFYQLSYVASLSKKKKKKEVPSSTTLTWRNVLPQYIRSEQD